jgi:hypothetical protein
MGGGRGQWSCRDLADRLNAEGVPKPGARSQTGGWIQETISWMLRNVAYVGKTYSVSRDRREGELIQANWPGIVEESSFEAAQRVADRYQRAGRGSRSHEYGGGARSRGCGVESLP